jgi:hypothetical protein
MGGRRERPGRWICLRMRARSCRRARAHQGFENGGRSPPYEDRSSGGREGAGGARGMENGEGIVDGPQPGVGVRDGLRAGLVTRPHDRPEGPARAELVRRAHRRRRRGFPFRARRPLARRGARGEPEGRERLTAQPQAIEPVEQRRRARGRDARMAAAGLCLARRDEGPRRERQQGAGPGDRPPCPGRRPHGVRVRREVRSQIGDGRPETPAIGHSIIGPGRQQGLASFTREHAAEGRREDSP